MSLKEDLEAKIKQEEMRLAELEVEISKTTARLAELRSQRTAEALVRIVSSWQPILPTAAVPLTNAT